MAVFLTESERERLNNFPRAISPEDLHIFFTLSPTDKAEVRKQYGSHNKLGFSLQLCALRYLGFLPDDLLTASQPMVAYLAQQLAIASPDISDYGNRSQTRTEHFQHVQTYLQFRKAGVTELETLADWLLDRALEHDKPTLLLQLACEKLHHDKIVRPGVTILERMIIASRSKANDLTFQQVKPLLSQERQIFLDQLLIPDSATNRTLLTWVRQRETCNSSPAIVEAIKKLVFLREQGVESWNVSGINPNRVKLLAQLGRKSTNQILQRMIPERRYPILLIFLKQTLVDITDEIIEMFDRCFMETYARARRNLDEFRKANSRSTNEKIVLLGKLCIVLSDPTNTDSPEHLHKTLYNQFSVETLKMLAQECGQIARPLDDSYFDFWAKRYGYFRMFSREFIKAFDFHSNKSDGPILKGLMMLRALNEEEKRKVPDNAPTAFVTPKWRQYVFDKKGGIDRHYWELCLLWELRNALRSGDIWLHNSRRYANPESYLIPSAQWITLKSDVCQQIQAPADGAIRLQERSTQLDDLLFQADQMFTQKNGKVRIENNKLSISRLEAEELPERIVKLQQLITKRLPKVELSDLLIEVDSWTNFSSQFEHAGGSQPRNKEFLTYLYASIHAQACNFGLSQMAEISHLSYDRIAWTTNWYIREDTLKSATNMLVNYQYHQPLSRFWGGGTLSSSDGQRLPVTVESKKAVALPRYFGYGKGLTFYTWTSDQFSQYGTKVVSSTVRDATYVLDEILDNQTELEILEHTTDTAGYTEIVFALFDLLGLRFSPRIKDLPDQSLYRLNKQVKYQNLEPLLKGTINTKLILAHYDDLLRLAGSLKLGWVTASLIISKLQAHPRQNSLTRALIEYGCLIKTRFVLRYLLSENVRKEINLQLNKGEAMHALRRFIFFANEGKIRKSQDDMQTNQAGSLSLMTNAVVTWNTVYMQQAINQLKAEGYEINEDDLKHISPARHEHINPYGKYEFNVEEELNRKGLRPLRKG